jgi:hypothetical protein
MSRDASDRQRFVRLGAALRREKVQLEGVVAEAEEALRDFAAEIPSKREVRGIGAIVHDFYTGAERIFQTIAPELNGGVPAGPTWHRALLQSMALELPGVRPALLREHTAGALEEFLRFRHLFRNVYGFELEWVRLRPLLARLPGAWQDLRTDLDRFLEFLDATARA